MAGDVGWSISRVLVTVKGRLLADLRGAMKPEIMDAVPTRIMGGGKKALGFNEYPNANALDYTFTIAAPSGDEQFLDAIVASHETVDLIVTYEDADDFPDSAYTGLTTRGKLSRAPRQDGDEVGENAYTLHG